MSCMNYMIHWNPSTSAESNARSHVPISWVLQPWTMAWCQSRFSSDGDKSVTSECHSLSSSSIESSGLERIHKASVSFQDLRGCQSVLEGKLFLSVISSATFGDNTRFFIFPLMLKCTVSKFLCALLLCVSTLLRYDCQSCKEDLSSSSHRTSPNPLIPHHPTLVNFFYSKSCSSSSCAPT